MIPAPLLQHTAIVKSMAKEWAKSLTIYSWLGLALIVILPLMVILTLHIALSTCTTSGLEVLKELWLRLLKKA